ncbi:MAG: hypothetical protein CMB97_00405 [Flavobacteriaceae bacterium]|nr:hypothetical protein [Flavobacteriaceae bacterium]
MLSQREFAFLKVVLCYLRGFRVKAILQYNAAPKPLFGTELRLFLGGERGSESTEKPGRTACWEILAGVSLQCY